MALSIEEQEITISAMRGEDFAVIYCSDKTWITKMDKLVEKSPDLFVITSETEYGKMYKFPKRLLSIRSSIVKRKMTEEQRQFAAERMRNIRNKDGDS